MANHLIERAVLMRLSISLPGEHRQDPELSSSVKQEHNLGAQAGRWIKQLFPPEALQALKKLDNEARTYHATLTLPYDTGIGILPAALIMEYGDKMRELQSKRSVLIDSFIAQPERWIEWAMTQHNGTFDPGQYPGCRKLEPGETTPQSVEAVLCGRDYVIERDEWEKKMRKKFSFSAEPSPVPASEHFCNTVASLLGTDTKSVDQRVQDAEIEAQRELLRRLLAPVAAMAAKLAEEPKVKADGTKADDIVFRDSLVGNLQEIARLAPAMNLACDPEIDRFVQEVEGLTRYSPKVLRDDKATRAEAQKAADALAKKMAAYQF